MPSARAESPQHVSSSPRIAKEIPAARKSVTSARVTFCVRASNAPKHPGQKIYGLDAERREELAPFRRTDPPGIAVVLQITERLLRFLRERLFHQDGVPAQLDQPIHMADEGRALCLAGAARRAGPEFLRRDDFAVQLGSRRPILR